MMQFNTMQINSCSNAHPPPTSICSFWQTVHDVGVFKGGAGGSLPTFQDSSSFDIMYWTSIYNNYYHLTPKMKRMTTTTLHLQSAPFSSILFCKPHPLLYFMLDEVESNIIVATDGSIREGVTAWDGTVWKDRVIVYEWSAAKHGNSSSFQAESEALEDALTWLSRNTQSEDNAIILTDSLSLVSKMVGGKLKEGWERLIQKIQDRLTISYIPERWESSAGGC